MFRREVNAGRILPPCAVDGGPLKSRPMTKSTTDLLENPLPPAIAAMSFEEAMAELEGLVRRLEDGRAKLDDAIGAYERGALLKRHCESLLRAAQARIETVMVQADGSVKTSPL